MSSITPKTAYPILARIFEARERDLVDRLPALYPDESDRKIAQEVLLPLWRSSLATAVDSFMTGTHGPSSTEALASFCSDIGKIMRQNRFLLDIEGRGKPLYDYIVACRRSVGTAIAKQLKTECEVAVNRERMTRHGVARGRNAFRLITSEDTQNLRAIPVGSKRTRIRSDARSARRLSA